MYHYNFSNDLRLDTFLSTCRESAYRLINKVLPSEEIKGGKSLGNVCKTYRYYLYSGCTGRNAELVNKGYWDVVLVNFIKKFQFPNLPTADGQALFNENKSEGICLPPMRVIIQILFQMDFCVDLNDRYLTRDEILNFVFFNKDVAKHKNPNIIDIIDQITKYRKNKKFPKNVETDDEKRIWGSVKKKKDSAALDTDEEISENSDTDTDPHVRLTRQSKHILTLMSHSGLVSFDSKSDCLTLNKPNTLKQRAFLLDIINCNDYWEGDTTESYHDYMEISNQELASYDIKLDIFLNAYERAAKIIKEYAEKNKNRIQLIRPKEISDVRLKFLEILSVDKLKALSDKEILSNVLYSSLKEDSLCHLLEYSKNNKLFGGIKGGYAFKYGVYQDANTQQWITGSSNNKINITEDDAIEFGKNLINALEYSAAAISSVSLESVADLNGLDNNIKEIFCKFLAPQINKGYITENFYKHQWIHKYFSILFPDKLSSFHSDEWQYHVLRCLGIKPYEGTYARSAQIALIQNHADLQYFNMFKIIEAKFGYPIKFVSLDIGCDSIDISNVQTNGKTAISISGHLQKSLDEFAKEGIIASKTINAELDSLDSEKDNSSLSTIISNFYNLEKNSVISLKNGSNLIGFIYYVEKYSFINDEIKHIRNGTFFKCNCIYQDFSFFDNQNAFSLISDESDILKLYELFYDGPKKVMNMNLVYKTNVANYNFERNRIIFGAPGTGKSYCLKKDSEKLLNNNPNSLERVTFHPEYSYSQFVGCYKPVMDDEGKTILYKYVPGPFMRVFVESLKDAMNNSSQPHLLIIEEINRANVASVFGDIFQLLDRDSDGISEYDIQTSEDIKKYLAEEIGGIPSDYSKIRIPNNMFIWSTMNSADQGVYPMDTAFKRRWNFEYLGIDDGESKIEGKGVFKINETEFEWNKIRKAINRKLTSNEFRVNEDKLIGPFFLGMNILESNDQNKFIEVFKNKVLMYLYEDAVKHTKHKFFEGCDSSKYSSVCREFDKIGFQIFGQDFIPQFYNNEES